MPLEASSAIVISIASYAFSSYVNRVVNKELRILGSLGIGVALFVASYLKEQQEKQQTLKNVLLQFHKKVLPQVAQQKAIDLTTV